eukprot:CAMPEP_0201283710 /NCGR_PEP_ID=MMETSP1317-20130820/42148_1 /ASSEMBLY_ACC=CAM_ASM_000770 /TAXON_ID=187299 /ORGANISM="Undescribed Undescribed, Strain Undescribed" /LENGTH=43 /DNA_ID= /DNA_START= /DNA_END= /DNA_ORIENTATION=
MLKVLGCMMGSGRTMLRMARGKKSRQMAVCDMAFGVRGSWSGG